MDKLDSLSSIGDNRPQYRKDTVRVTKTSYINALGREVTFWRLVINQGAYIAIGRPSAVGVSINPRRGLVAFDTKAGTFPLTVVPGRSVVVSTVELKGMPVGEYVAQGDGIYAIKENVDTGGKASKIEVT